MTRTVIAVIVGIVAGGIVNMAFIMLSWVIFRPPEGADMTHPETLRAYIESLPPPAFVLVLIAHGGGASAGGFVAARVAGRRAMMLGSIVGGVFLIGGVINSVMIPRPIWFAVVDVLLYVPCGIAGAGLAPVRTVPPAERS